MVTPSLAEFLIRAPSCYEDSNFKTILNQFEHTDTAPDSQYCILLHTSGRPVGCVNVTKILSHLSSCIAVRASGPSSMQDSSQDLSFILDTNRPLKERFPDLIEPIELLLAETPLHQAWPSLEHQRIWVLVDAQQIYLGLLDSWSVLRFIARHNQSESPGSNAILKPDQDEQSVSALKSPLSHPEEPPWRTLAEAFANSRLPVMFQNSHGQVLNRNGAWEKHLGTWQPWQATAASNSGTALAVSIARQDELGLGIGTSGAAPMPVLDIDIRQTQVCDVNQVCGQWDIIRIPISTPQVSPESIANEMVWLCLGQPETATATFQQTWQPTPILSTDDLKDEILGCLSHELKSAITALLGLSKLLLDSRVGHLNERQTHYSQLIQHNAQNLKATINEVLDVTRAMSGQMALTPMPVVLGNLIHNAVEQAQTYNHLRRKLASSPPFDLSNRIEYKIQPGLTALFVDELRIRQMLTHLLSNALKYTPYTGQVGVTVERWSDWIALTVWDTGYGIHPAQQPLVFHRLQWLDNNISPLFLCPGVGLLLTRQLARLQGGELTFQSEPNVGSQFTILLPYRSPKQSSVTNYDAKSPQSQRLVVLIDIDVAGITRFSQQLKKLGYRAAIARSPQEAIDKIIRLRPCAVFLRPAANMPADSTLQQLKQHEGIAALPIITLAETPLSNPRSDNPAIEIPISDESLRQILNQRSAISVDPIATLDKTQLIVLHIKPPSQLRTPAHNNDLSLLLQQYDCRILEVDDIEQADLLVLIWKPQVVLLDPDLDQNPSALFQQISGHANLAALPLVTLTGPMTQAANSFSNLAIYPYLAPLAPNTLTTAEASPLIDVLKIAASQGNNP